MFWPNFHLVSMISFYPFFPTNWSHFDAAVSVLDPCRVEENDWEIWEIFSSSFLLWELNFHTSHCLWPPLGEWKLIYWKDLICNKRIQAQKRFWLNSKIIELENYINQKFRSKMRIEIITDIIMLLSFLTFEIFTDLILKLNMF